MQGFGEEKGRCELRLGGLGQGLPPKHDLRPCKHHMLQVKETIGEGHQFFQHLQPGAILEVCDLRARSLCTSNLTSFGSCTRFGLPSEAKTTNSASKTSKWRYSQVDRKESVDRKEIGGREGGRMGGTE
eukprot:1922711-Rhodomonas_salina.3